MSNQHTPQLYQNIFTRLLSNIEEPENDQACWLWKGKVWKRYPHRINIRCRGKHCQIKPHRAMLTILECGGETELFADLYDAYSVAGFEADHLCFHSPLCINPDHLQWLTQEQHKEKNCTYIHPDQRKEELQ